MTRALKLYRAALKPYLIPSTVVTCFLLLVYSSNNRTLEERNRAPHVSRARDDANHTHPIAPLRPYFDVLAAATPHPLAPRRARNGRRWIDRDTIRYLISSYLSYPSLALAVRLYYTRSNEKDSPPVTDSAPILRLPSDTNLGNLSCCFGHAASARSSSSASLPSAAPLSTRT